MKNLLLIFCLLIANWVAAQPDLTIANAKVYQNTTQPGSLLSIEFRVTNLGTSAAGLSHCRIYLSTTPTVSSTSVLLAEQAIDSLVSGKISDAIYLVQSVPYAIEAGTYYLLITTDARNAIAESNENNLYVIPQTINITASPEYRQHLPYPVLLIHGLNSNDTVWKPFLQDMQAAGLSYGGNLDFCLNQDGSTSTSNKQNDIGNWTDAAALQQADFYTLNFDVGPTGIKYTNSLGSNQSAIVKQGIALKRAIQYILDVTGRNKVVLAGHSMGGLTSREYLQNVSNWQVDGQHHVAKLLTVGTPHGGSNTSFGPLSPIAGALGAVDESSEAVRDLRYSYISGSAGVYLFGGVESAITMSNFPSSYHNYDVNCNGTNNNLITGLNSKTLPRDLSYTCIIGDGSWIGGDGIVDAARANLNNYYPDVADTLMSIQAASNFSLWHLQIAYQTDRILCGIDEPSTRSFAYPIASNQFYFGRITPQSGSNAAIADIDRYSITNTGLQQINFQLNNVSVQQATVTIYDSLLRIVAQIPAKNGVVNAQQILDSGNYYIDVMAQPDSVSTNRLYALKWTPTGTANCTGAWISYTSTQVGLTYQWQADFGSGFVNLIESDTTKGTQTIHLEILPNSAMIGTKYRCLVDGTALPAFPELKFENRWTGQVNRDWENPLNWGCTRVPDGSTDVIIPANTLFQPEVSGKAYCRSLQIKPAAMILIKTGAELLVTH
jgi:pimeloyl-ACP methyl ester carboxylesterase